MHRQGDGRFRALATDYDGTIAYGPRPAPEVLDAIASLRRAGWAVVLVTGRIRSDLRTIFPDVEAWFDALVLENGAVLGRPGREHGPLAPPVSPALAQALRARGLPVELGEVLLATDTVHEPVVRAEVSRLGLDLALVHNREALMVLPAGVSKGTGLRAALAELGIDPAQAIGVGDAENDLDLLAACGLGVAVENAILALKARAGRLLTAPGPAGIAAFLRSL